MTNKDTGFDPGKFLSRKFIAWVVVVALASWALMAGRLDSWAWVHTVIWTTAAYIGFNTAQKFRDKTR